MKTSLRHMVKMQLIAYQRACMLHLLLGWALRAPRLNHVTAEGQTGSNNDFGRGHEQLVRRLNKSEDMNDRVFGTFHQ